MSQTPQPYDDSTGLSLQKRVDEVCLRFERAWKAGQRPALEEFLGDTPEPERAVLCRELIALELVYRRQAGETPQKEEYEARFPDINLSPHHALAAPSAGDPDGTPPPVDSESPVPGVRYRILREHAKGALGAVFLAQDDELHRQVALKEIQEKYAHHPESASSWKRR
jgi:serine/threonine-protein kinase